MDKSEYTAFLNETRNDREPALRTGVVTGTGAAVLSTVLYLFPDLSGNDLKLVLIITCFLLPIVSEIQTRGKVWSSASVSRYLYLLNSTAKAQQAMKSNPEGRLGPAS